MKYDISHFDYMDEYMLSIIKIMDIYVKNIMKNNVKKDDWMLICKIQWIIDDVWLMGDAPYTLLSPFLLPFFSSYYTINFLKNKKIKLEKFMYGNIIYKKYLNSSSNLKLVCKLLTYKLWVHKLIFEFKFKFESGM